MHRTACRADKGCPSLGDDSLETARGRCRIKLLGIAAHVHQLDTRGWQKALRQVTVPRHVRSTSQVHSSEMQQVEANQRGWRLAPRIGNLSGSLGLRPVLQRLK